MVCDRCIAAVKKELDRLNLPYSAVELGEVETIGNLIQDEIDQFRVALQALGFELIESKNARMVSQIKKVAMAWVRDEGLVKKKSRFSTYLSDSLHKDYALLSHLFSEIESTTIEQFLIRQKIERAKELLVYDELTLGEIADHLDYSSPSHLSNQFKKVTGLTPGHFKKIGAQKRNSIDKV